MKLFGLVLSTLFLIALTASYAQDKKDTDIKAKLIGIWESKEGNKVEFSKDGKLKINIKVQEKEISVDGTYTVEGNKLTCSIKDGDTEFFKEILTIKSVDDKKLVTENLKGKVDELMKKK